MKDDFDTGWQWYSLDSGKKLVKMEFFFFLETAKPVLFVYAIKNK